MTTSNLFLQLGIAGAVLFVMWQLMASKMRSDARAEEKRLDIYARAEEKRTEAIVDGFASLTGKVDSHHTLDIQSHQAIATSIATLSGQVTEAISWQERTPIGGPPTPEPAKRAPHGFYSIGKKER